MQYDTHITMLNDALYRAKVDRKLTRQQIAKNSGVSYNIIGSWTRGENKPTFFMLKAVINACGYKVNYTMEKK